MNLNKIFILGNLTRDPERRTLPSGQAVVNFGMATNRFYNDQNNQRQQETEFHNVVAFGKTAEIIDQYLKKGSLALIEGRVRTRSWDDKTTNIKRYMTEIITEKLQLGPRNASSQQVAPSFQGYQQQNQAPVIKNAVADNEIPIIEDTPSSQAMSPEQAPQGSNNSEEPRIEPIKEEDEEIDVSKIPF